MRKAPINREMWRFAAVARYLLWLHLSRPRLTQNRTAFYVSWQNQNFSLLHYNQLKSENNSISKLSITFSNSQNSLFRETAENNNLALSSFLIVFSLNSSSVQASFLNSTLPLYTIKTVLHYKMFWYCKISVWFCGDMPQSLFFVSYGFVTTYLLVLFDSTVITSLG